MNADLASRLEALSPEKRALLERALAARGAGGGSGGAAAPEESTHSDRAPLTDAQHLLWLAEQMHPADAAYNVPIARRVRGVLDVRALEQALTAVVAAHEALRTTFVEENGEPFQRIGAPWDVRVHVADLRSSPESARAGQVAGALRDAASAPFDLASGPLLRALVVRLDGETILLIVVHHLVFDGASIDLLLRDLAAAYEAAQRGERPVVDPPQVQPAGLVSPGGSVASAAFWRSYLEGASAEVNLPADQTEAIGGAARAVMEIPAASVAAIERTAATFGATTFMVLLAAFEAVLHRYTEQDDLLIGVPVAARAYPEAAATIGHLTETVLVRARVSSEMTFGSLLLRTRDDFLRTLEHAAGAAAALRGIQASKPDAVTGPRLLFGLQPSRGGGATLGGMPLEPVATVGGAPKFVLAINGVQTADCIRLTAEFSADRYMDGFVSRLLRQYVAFLDTVVTRPDSRVGAVGIITPEERERVFGVWNATDAPYPADATLVSLVESQVRRSPSATAVTADGRAMTYSELDAAAERFATALRGCGIAAGALVGVCMARSERLIAALLGVLKTGAAYVPLDPAYPAERLAFILSDTAASVIVTEAALRAEHPWLAQLATGEAHAPQLVLADSVLSDDPSSPAATAARGGPATGATATGATATDVAYVIYTSGSTGQPKGVLIEHRSAVALVSWAVTVFSPDELSGVLAATSVCFDLSVFEIFVTLCAGGAVIMAADALALPDAARASRVPVTLINTVPSAIGELLRTGGIPATVRTVNLAGELLPQHIVDVLYSLPHVERVYDLYGPSEDTTYSTFVLRERGGRASIGRPIANTRVYVLDAQQQPVPVGVPGELYLAGAGLARGYLNRPDLTEERFLQLALPSASGSRIERVYRTGDRVRFLGDGRLEYLGRFDHQIKLRGFRIELGEIETRLVAHPAVRQAAVVLRELSSCDSGAEQALVAFYVPRDVRLDAGAAPDQTRDLDAALRAHLRAALPAYMIPAALVPLAALPLTPAGKIDRKALAARELVDVATRSGAAPQTAVERAVADVWGLVLGRTVNDVEASFLDLGGHSLLATRVVSQVARIFGTNLSLRSFFGRPTVSGHAAALIAADPIPGRAERIAAVFLQARGASSAPAVPSYAPFAQSPLHAGSPS